MRVLLSLQQVNKKYNHRLVLNSVNLDIYERQSLSIVGHNGSGKSTLLKIISGIILPSSGTVVKKRESIRFGYVPEKISYHLPFTPSEYLYHMGRINRLSKPYLTKRIQYLLNLFSLDDTKDSRMNKFSKGMQQKINIMQALLTKVDLLILDEPLSGLDPAAQQEFENILQQLKKNMTIIFSCHEQKLLNKVADRILTLNHQTICRDDLSKSKMIHIS